jgi:hypothetical protein
MTTVIVYRSTDASAPVLTGINGSLVSLLDACLVNGYGAKAAAGWTIAYTNTNQRQYKLSAVDGTGCQLFVDDSGPGTGGGREAFLTGFKTGTAIGAGTGQFPTFGQLSYGIGAVIARKSATADSTARAWTLIADDTVFYLFMENGDYYSPTLCSVVSFGDFFSYAASDPYRCLLIGRNNAQTTTNSTTGTYDWFSQFSYGDNNSNFMNLYLAGHFCASNFNGIGTSLKVGKHSDMFKMAGGRAGQGSTDGNAATGNQSWAMGVVGQSGAFGSSMPYPNPPDSGLYLAPVWIHHGGFVRGYLKGIWTPVQYTPLSHNDTFSGSGTLSGKSFLVQAVQAGTQYNGALGGQCHIETSSTWS